MRDKVSRNYAHRHNVEVDMMLTTMMFLAATAAAQTLTITGSGRATTIPDHVSFTVGVKSSADTVAAAVRENNAKAARIVAALREAGAMKNEIQTSGFTLSRMAETRGPYIVTNTVIVTHGDVKRGGTLLRTAIDAGANEAGQIRFLATDTSALRDAALARAFADARTRAENLALVAGRKLGAVETMTVDGAAFESPSATLLLPYFEVGTARAPTIAERLVEVTASVTVTFTLE